MDLMIRVAVVEDAEGIGAAHVAAWLGAYPGLIPDDHLARLDPVARGRAWRTSIEAGTSDATTLVARVGDRVAGFVSYGPSREEVDDGWGELWAINLHPDRWRQGIGTALVHAAEAGLRGLGYDYGYLWVLDGNQRAIDFYRRVGWPTDGAIKIDDQYDPPRRELRCSTRLQREGE
ncbi:GNAT family N-acetyltransferase [Microlunatus sp. Gsoil 973]|nr:GNAT family N-acetyltransferase [Microlunatus sp. Gsoil 973]